MSAFLHGVADRNMSVRKSYAMALGHLVRVCSVYIYENISYLYIIIKYTLFEFYVERNLYTYKYESCLM
jgi:hypothetical protein